MINVLSLRKVVDTMGQYMWLYFIFLDTTCVNMVFFMLILFFHCSPFFAYAYVYNVSFWGKVLTFTDSSGCSVYFLKNTFDLYLNQYQPNLKPSPSTKSAPYSFRIFFFFNTWIDSFRHKEIDKMYCSYPFWIRMVFCLPSFWAIFSYYPNTIQYIKIHSHKLYALYIGWLRKTYNDRLSSILFLSNNADLDASVRINCKS